ncbi:MAG: hypothetical protein ACM3N5_06920 [Candidatus Eiseniibacteriota bacterium]
MRCRDRAFGRLIARLLGLPPPAALPYLALAEAAPQSSKADVAAVENDDGRAQNCPEDAPGLLA